MQTIYSKQALKYLNSLEPKIMARIEAGIAGLTKEPPTGDLKKLGGKTDQFRLRVGNFRVLYHRTSDFLAIDLILPRGEVYKFL